MNGALLGVRYVANTKAGTIECAWCREHVETVVMKSLAAYDLRGDFVGLIRQDGPLCPSCAARWESENAP